MWRHRWPKLKMLAFLLQVKGIAPLLKLFGCILILLLAYICIPDRYKYTFALYLNHMDKWPGFVLILNKEFK